MNNYLIPANTKKSQYILGFFTPTDLCLFSVGCIISFALVLVVKDANLFILIICLLPAFIASFLVMPVPYYHNVLQLLTNLFNFYTNQRKFYWKGWCIYERFNPNDK